MRAKTRTRDNDLELVSLCQKGDISAFETLVKQHQKRMLNIAYRIVGNYDEACEVVQDAFIGAYKSIASFQRKAKFSTWLCSIVINLSRNRLKRLKIRHYREVYSTDDPIVTADGEIMAEYPSGELSPLERLEEKDIQQRVEGCMNTLDEEFKTVLVLRDIQGFSYEEISDMLRVPEGTVKSRLFRAREAMRDCLMVFKGER